MDAMSFLLAGFVGLILTIGLARFAFRINHQIALQEMQLKINILMAKKLGVSHDDIDDALKEKK